MTKSNSDAANTKDGLVANTESKHQVLERIFEDCHRLVTH